jgi:hypothetical protein
MTLPPIGNYNQCNFGLDKTSDKVEEPIPDTLRFRTTKESELDMKFF